MSLLRGGGMSRGLAAAEGKQHGDGKVVENESVTKRRRRKSVGAYLSSFSCPSCWCLCSCSSLLPPRPPPSAFS